MRQGHFLQQRHMHPRPIGLQPHKRGCYLNQVNGVHPQLGQHVLAARGPGLQAVDNDVVGEALYLKLRAPGAERAHYHVVKRAIIEPDERDVLGGDKSLQPCRGLGLVPPEVKLLAGVDLPRPEQHPVGQSLHVVNERGHGLSPDSRNRRWARRRAVQPRTAR